MKKIDTYSIIFWALFIGFCLGGLTIVMISAFMA
jgi:hypothetical protein